MLSRQLTSSRNATDVPEFSPEELYRYMLHDNPELRQEILLFLKNDLYKPNYYLSLMEMREITLQRLKALVAQKFFSVRDYISNPRKFMASMECLALCDYSFAIKSGVHFTLCGGTIAKLGTKKHHDAYLPGIDNLSLPGCFGMTELGHGSNVMGIETTAVYDARAQEFVINTPNNEASKYWIGGAGQHAKICAVFAQLTIDGKWEGPHVFVVRLRDDDGVIMPGVRIKDNGPKMGLNGVDNGQIWFDNVRVSRDALLDAFATVSPEGTYSSKIKNVTQRFGTMVGGLTTGRICIASGAVDACKQALIIAIKYAVERPQFGDRVIMDYVTHQRRLLPALASTWALHNALGHLKALTDAGPAADAKSIHVLSSGLKAAATWTRVEVVQQCRECCGGMGFLAANKLGSLKTDMDVDVTFEGDNTVMMQQVAKALLESKSVPRQAPSPPPGPLAVGPDVTHQLLALMAFREQALTYQVASAMSAAAQSGGAAAAAAAFDSQLDLVVGLGWAAMERQCLALLMDKAGRAPSAGLRSLLLLMCRLYGLSCVERQAGFYLDQRALQPGDAARLRQGLMACCQVLSANNSRLALKVCDSFGVPSYLLNAPIAENWRGIGAQ